MSKTPVALPAGQKNGPKEMMAYFNVPTKGEAAGNPTDGIVKLTEFNGFWKELDEDSKNILRYTDLATL